MFSTSTFAVVLPLLLSSLATTVSAHGFVRSITVNGDKKFTGPIPDERRNNAPSIIRQITTPFPNYGADNDALNCGPGAMRASEVADLMPGDVLEFDWRGHDLSPWPHNTGPEITYMASCGDTPCNEFDSRNAQWFKVDQRGRKDNSGEWFQNDLMQGGLSRAEIPKNLAPGNYLVRHEIIALHIASGFRQAEFYPSCSQWRVGGSGSGRAAASETVKFPGGYNDEDKGIHVNVFSGGKYEFPGPALAALTGGDAGSGSGTEGSGAPTKTSTEGSKPTEGSGSGSNSGKNSGKDGKSGSNKKCRLKKNEAKSRAAAREAAATPAPTPGNVKENYPRHVSRVMRRLVGTDFRIAATSS